MTLLIAFPADLALAAEHDELAASQLAHPATPVRL